MALYLNDIPVPICRTGFPSSLPFQGRLASVLPVIPRINTNNMEVRLSFSVDVRFRVCPELLNRSERNYRRTR
jgi:hypothetical protein